MQNIKKPCREPYISRERDPQSGASGGRLVLGVLELLSTINIVELKKMASPSVPSVSRVETSSESSSDSTSTTTSTVSEHSKTSNIINRYSCSVERGLYWVPYGFRWFDLDSTRFTRPVPVAATQCAIDETCRLPQYRVPVPTSRDVSSSETESDDLASGRVSFGAGRRIESWEQ